MIPEHVSSKLKWLSVVATLTVVWIHSNSMAFLPDLPDYCRFLSRFLMISLTSWAVPCFFMISGFLLVYSYKDSYEDLLKKKVRSLLLPYFCWAAIGTILIIPLTLACNLLQGKTLWCNSFIEAGNYSVFGVIDKVFGIVNDGPIANGPLWYVRILLLLFLISPVFILIYKSNKTPILEFSIAIFIILFVNSKSYMIWDFALKPWAVTYFILGMAAAKIDFWEKRIPGWLVAISGLFWLSLSAYDGFAFISAVKNYAILMYPWKIFCAIIFWSGLYDMCTKQADRLVNFIPMTFFIYCLHQPILAYFRSFARFFFRNNSIFLFVFCIISFFGTLIICILAAKLLERLCPKLYNVLTGNR